jgi:RNA polymerase sigma-70 factor (ECF subfamily)
MNTPSDNQLVALALYGDAKAFELIVRQYQRIMYNALFTMLQDHGKAADATQEAFLRAYKALPSFRADAALKPWLLRIATNVGLNMIRDDKVRQADSLDRLLDESPQQEPKSSLSVECEVENRLAMSKLSDAMNTLPARQRYIFALRYQYDLSYADIAHTVGESESAIKSQLFRTREKLRELLYEHINVEGGA